MSLVTILGNLGLQVKQTKQLDIRYIQYLHKIWYYNVRCGGELSSAKNFFNFVQFYVLYILGIHLGSDSFLSE